MKKFGRKLDVSVVVVVYNMVREAARTLHTLSTAYQRDIGPDDYEVIVVDNGSNPPFDPNVIEGLSGNFRLICIDHASPSPAQAINRGIAEARGKIIGVMIDGARMASPRLLATALEAAQLHRRPVIGTLAFHLGPDLQWRSIANGYCQDVEDQLLASVDWTADGYRLFSISVFAGSSADGWFVIPVETSALFLTSQHWQALCGYDPAFVTPGGGLVNLDTWARACADPAGRVILLLGEGTFHQIHGGIVTNSAVSKWPLFHDEYVRLRGNDYERPIGTPLLVGRLHPAALASAKFSAERQLQLIQKERTMNVDEPNQKISDEHQH